jgi:hypothetical protein
MAPKCYAPLFGHLGRLLSTDFAETQVTCTWTPSQRRSPLACSRHGFVKSSTVMRSHSRGTEMSGAFVIGGLFRQPSKSRRGSNPARSAKSLSIRVKLLSEFPCVFCCIRMLDYVSDVIGILVREIGSQFHEIWNLNRRNALDEHEFCRLNAARAVENCSWLRRASVSPLASVSAFTTSPQLNGVSV